MKQWDETLFENYATRYDDEPYQVTVENAISVGDLSSTETTIRIMLS